MPNAINAVRERSQRLYAAAQRARERGDNAEAYALLAELLPLLEPAGERASKHVVLAQMATLLVQGRDYARALEHWSAAVPLAEAEGDLHGASMLLDRMAAFHAGQGAWRHALQRWEQALALDTRLGKAHDCAVTLANVGLASAQVGDKLRADRCWSDALAVFESAKEVAPAVAIVRAMQAIAVKTGDWSDPLEIRARVLHLAEAADDPRSQVIALDGIAQAALQLDEYAKALPHLERASALAVGLGDAETSSILQEKIAYCQAHMRSEKYSPHFVREPRRYASVSEYDIAPGAAPFFLVGELWAGLHARGMPLRGLRVGDVTVSPAGIARLSADVRLTSGPPFEPESAAADLLAALERYSPEGATALLAGYARCGFEVLDIEQPGFTDTVLDHFEIPEPRPRAMRAMNVEALCAALGVHLHVSDGQIATVVREASGPSIAWQNAPELTFHFVLALLVAGVDCRALWERDAAVTWPAFELLLPISGAVPDSEPDQQRLLEIVPPGLELAAGLAWSLRRISCEEPFDFNHVLPWAREVLTNGPDAQAMALGDNLIDVALHCAALLRPKGEVSATSCLQKALILLEYTGRGQPSDEARLVAITRALRSQPHVYPAPFGRWPTECQVLLGLWNSLLLALRKLATESVAAQERGHMGVLRSAALRGVCTARHVLRLSYAAANSRDPEVAASSLALLRVTIKNYALLLQAFCESAALEHASTGHSAWLPWFSGPGDSSHLKHELHWIVGLFEAAAREGFSLDVARPFMRAGAEFYAEENAQFTLPSTISGRPAAN